MSYINSKKYGTAIQLYKKVNGDIAYYITYKDEDNKLKRIKVGDKSKGITESYCNQKRIEIINSIKLGEEPPALVKKKKNKKAITVDKVAQKYLENLKIHMSSINALHIAKKYEKHIFPILGSKAIEKVTVDDLEKLQKEKIKTLSPTTVNQTVEMFGTIFNFGVNPTSKIKKFKIDNARERYLTKKEIEELLKQLSSNELLTLFTKLALSTGGRLETILNIQVKDLNLEDKMITLKDLKNSSSYKGFIRNDLLEYLKEYTSNLSANSYVIGGKYEKFPNRTIQRQMKGFFDPLFNDGLDSRDAKNRVVIHTLRHTFASHLAINGTPIFTIQKLMNHKDINQTMRYAKLAPDSGKDFVNSLYE
jgi:integrase